MLEAVVDASSLVRLVAPDSSTVDEEQRPVRSHISIVTGFELDLAG